MFKIIIVLWFFRFFINLFTDNFVLKSSFKGYLNTLEKYNIEKVEEIDKLTSSKKVEVMGNMFFVLVVFVYKIFMILIDLILMLSMVKYDKTLITTLFIAITLVDILFRLIKSKFTPKSNDNLIESTRKSLYEFERASLYKGLCKIINVSYWAYAIYLLFF